MTQIELMIGRSIDRIDLAATLSINSSTQCSACIPGE